jgi:uncharacterized protein YjiS (DUF1127 family)
MATIETIYRSAESHGASKGKAKVSLMSMLSWLDGRLERRRSRRALLEMSDEQLKDIGLSHADVHFEANRPFWR